MSFMFRLFLIAGLIAFLPVSSSSSTDNSWSTTSAISAHQLGQMPLTFTENMGQWDEKVKFRADAGRATIWFASDGAYYQFTRSIIKEEGQVGPIDPAHLMDDHMNQEPGEYETIMIKAKFVGANPEPLMVGFEMMEYKCNYFLGNDPNEWHTDVPNYSAVLYEEIYNGIDLKYYGNGEQMEYDFIVSPGADFTQIKIKYEGAEAISVNTEGELVVETKWGEVREQKPVIYQIENGSRVAVDGSYSLKGASTFGFELASYNPALPLVIDPVLVYSTYLGGSSSDAANSIAVDSSGSAYIMGYLWSADFPMINPYQGEFQGGTFDVFVTKLSNTGNGLEYSTYLGGSGKDYGFDIAVDALGSAYLTGITKSTDFPTEKAYQTNQDTSDVFVTKLSSAGNSLIYSTYLGGSGVDNGYGIAVDSSGSAYVIGQTSSTDFPMINAYQDEYQGGYADVFVTKFSSDGSSLVYSTYLGGNGSEDGQAIAVDASGAAYLTGYTDAAYFPAFTYPYNLYHDGICDIFVSKLNPQGNSLIYSSLLGGEASDKTTGIAVDASGVVYITGTTYSSDFHAVNAYQETLQGFSDGFVTKLNSLGNEIIYSTYLGGSSYDRSNGIAVDASGAAYVMGETASSDYPTFKSYNAVLQGEFDAFVTKLSNAGDSLIYSSYLGGSGHDYGKGIAIDVTGAVYVTGSTNSTNFPILNPYTETNQGSTDVFVTKLTDGEIIVDTEDVPVGSDIIVQFNDQVSLTFDSVDIAGVTELELSTTGPAPVNFEIVPADPPIYYNITTTAIFDGQVEVCLTYTEADINYIDESGLQMFHFNGTDWDEITTTIDELNNTICGLTSSMSPFVIGRQPTAVSEGLDEELPQQFMLDQNYPNPFNPVTEIYFDLPKRSLVKLEIFNVKGQLVTTLQNGYFNAGHHSVTWNASLQASGIYLYRLTTNEFVATKKMILVK